MKGKFIVFEGLDGSGTTTQTRLFTEKLTSLGVPVWATAEPVSESPTGRLIRTVLRGEESVTPETLAYLYAADRHEHLYGKDGVIEHLEAGDTVICDRYKFSSLAYQSVNCNPEFVEALNKDFPNPDILFYLNTPVETCMKRIADRKSTPEIFEKENFLQKVSCNYLAAIDNDSKSTSTIFTTIIPGDLPIEYIALEAFLNVGKASREIFHCCDKAELRKCVEAAYEREHELIVTLGFSL